MVEEDGWMDLLCEWSGEVEGELAGAGVFLVWRWGTRWRSLKVLSSGTHGLALGRPAASTYLEAL